MAPRHTNGEKELLHLAAAKNSIETLLFLYTTNLLFISPTYIEAILRIHCAARVSIEMAKTSDLSVAFGGLSDWRNRINFESNFFFSIFFWGDQVGEAWTVTGFGVDADELCRWPSETHKSRIHVCRPCVCVFWEGGGRLITGT